MNKRIGGITYEGRYFIVEVPQEWRAGDTLPPTSPEDLWFDRYPDFVAALRAPFDHRRVDRRPWNAVPVERPQTTPMARGRF